MLVVAAHAAHAPRSIIPLNIPTRKQQQPAPLTYRKKRKHNKKKNTNFFSSRRPPPFPSSTLKSPPIRSMQKTKALRLHCVD